VQLVQVTDRIYVVNLIGQHGIRRSGSNSAPPIRYDAIREGLARVREHAMELNATIHMPRIGCGLAGGTWDLVAPIIEEELCAYGVEVTVYDLP
jgi:O-acetyl-ADP-ribose deacetylase (regulator of RNase III)